MNNEEYRFDVEGNVEIKGQQSIEKVDNNIKALADSVTSAEDAVKKLNAALSSLKSNGVKPTVDLSEIEKAINVIDKKIDNALDHSINAYAKNAAQLSSESVPLRTSEGLKAKAEVYLARERENQRLSELRYQKMISNVRGQNKSWNSFNPISDEISHYQNQRSANAISSIQKTVALENKLSEANKVFDKFTDGIVSSFEKRINEINKLLEDRNAGFTLGASGPVESAGAAMKSAFYSQINARKEAPLLLTSYAGVSKEVKETLEAERKLKEAKEKEALSAEEAAETQDSITKKKKMTEFQEEKIRVADKRNAINEERVSKIEDQTSARYLDRMDKLAEARMLNAKANQAGALLNNPRYQTGQALRSIGNTVSSWGTGGKAAGLLLDSIGELVKSPVAGTAVAVSNLVKGVSDLGKASIQAFSEIEAIKTQLGVVFSNQTQADSMFGEISQYAVHSPFGIQQTSELAVLLKQSGVYASDLMDTLKMLGDTAGGNMEKMKRIANNYAQIVSIGKASMLDMRQFAYAGIPIFEAVSKELGVSQQELRKLISDGKVTSDIIEKVFKDLTGINGIFENATEKGAKTLKARLQNLADAKQLSFGSIGEGITSVGERTGNDSYANRVVSWFEKLYQEIHDNVNIHNIEKDVNTIATRRNDIANLEQLIDLYKSQGKDTKNLEQLLEGLKSKIDPDTERSSYVALYNAISSGKFTVEELQRTYLDVWDEIKTLQNQRFGLGNSYWHNEAMSETYLNKNPYMAIAQYPDAVLKELWGLTGGANGRNARAGTDTRFEQDALQVQIDHLIELSKEILNGPKITFEVLKAVRENNALTAQQLAYDQTNKYANASTSLMSSFRELSSIYRSSDEYKAEQEKKRIDTLNEALDVLKKIKENTDGEDNVDITKFSSADLLDYQRRGAFTSAQKLNIVTGNTAIDSDNRALLMKQFGYALNQSMPFLQYTAGSKQNELKRINGLFSSLEEMTDTDFFNNFGSYFDQIKEIINLFTTSGNKTQIKDVQDLLDLSLLRLQTDTSGIKADPNSLSKTQFIPLWKRILSGATGLTTNGMTDTLSTMENYRNDMAIRNMTSSVLSATMKSMGLDTAMGLISTNSAVQLAGDGGKTFQTDWIATKKAIKDFATQLSASTEVISAYKKGLEDELNVYEQLVAAGYTQAESTDLGSQKFVTSKQLEKLSQGNSSQLVNAFGEVLETASGKRYNVSDITFREGQMYDQFGNKIDEEVKVTGKLFDFIKDEMPRLREEIRDANAAELNNTVLSNLYKDVASTQLIMKLINSRGLDKATQYLATNPDYIASDMSATIKYLLTKSKYQYSTLADKSNEEIIALALKSEGTNIQESIEIAGAKKLLDEVFRIIEEDADKLVNDSSFKELRDFAASKNRDDAVMKAVMATIQTREYGMSDPLNLKPRDYSGFRGVYNSMLEAFTGKELAYDKKDYYAQVLRTDEKYRFDSHGNDRTLSVDLIGNTVERTNEELVKTLSLSERIMITWEQGLRESANIMIDLGNSLASSLSSFAGDSFVKPFELMTKNLVMGKDATTGMKDAYKDLTAELLNASSQAMVHAGMELIARGAISNNWAMIAGGLGLAAAGGVTAGIGGALQDDSTDKTDDKLEKLENLKTSLADLIKQAREDSIYYEQTLRHKKAISSSASFKSMSVHDAVITPRGDVVTTDPKDYLIATKTPRTLVGGGSPNINFNLVDKSTGIRVKTQKASYDESTNTVNFEAIIENKVQEIIATSKGDDAFNARQMRLQGRQVVS